MSGGPPDPWDPGDRPGAPAEGDLLEGGLRPPWEQRLWSGLPRRARLLALTLVVLLAAGAGGLWLRERAAERAAARQVDLTASLEVSSLSTIPPGGQVSFFVVVRNEGGRALRITAVEGAAGGLQLRALDDAERSVSPDRGTAVPVSVRLTCARYEGGAVLTTAIAVRREDGRRVTRRVRLAASELLTDVAGTLCEVRPDLTGQELSGPVLDTGPRTTAGDAPDR